MEKFELSTGLLKINESFMFDDRQSDEEKFLSCVDNLVKQFKKDICIDLVRAGGLSSTIIALCIAADRKAKDAGKTLHLRVASRNTMAIKVSGIDKLIDVTLV
jgi:predicted hydrocarbon binding protein